jgi:hypothetical protein
MKTVSRVSDGELGVTAVNRVTGKARVIAKILSAGAAIRTIAIGPAKPRNSDAISDSKDGSGLSGATVDMLRSVPRFFADFFNLSDNLVTENQRQLRIGQFAVCDVKVSAANRAGPDAHEQLSPARLRLWHIAQFQWSSRFVENHRAHVTLPPLSPFPLVLDGVSDYEHQQAQRTPTGSGGMCPRAGSPSCS